jgi:aryl-alcohol dehydrogenase-like predicted oxidoreductase
MRYKPLGRTGLFVSEIGLGTMTFGGHGFWRAIGCVEQQTADRLVSCALGAGINLIDTADAYSDGESERILGKALVNLAVRRESVLIATKAYGSTGPGPNDRGASRHHLFNAVEASLERLRLEYIDIFQLHAFDPVTSIDQTLRALDDLLSKGLVRYLGCSNWSAWQLMKALASSNFQGHARFEALQAYYSLAGRELEREVIPVLNDQNLGLLVWSPLAGGLLSGKFNRETPGPAGARRTDFDFPPVDRERAWRIIDAMRPIAEGRGVSVAQVAIGWLLGQARVTSVIVGVKTVEQLEDNIAATRLTLSPDELKQLDAASQLPEEYPGWMLAKQGGERVPGPFGKQASDESGGG